MVNNEPSASLRSYSKYFYKNLGNINNFKSAILPHPTALTSILYNFSYFGNQRHFNFFFLYTYFRLMSKGMKRNKMISVKCLRDETIYG